MPQAKNQRWVACPAHALHPGTAEDSRGDGEEGPPLPGELQGAARGMHGVQALSEAPPCASAPSALFPEPPLSEHVQGLTRGSPRVALGPLAQEAAASSQELTV